MQLRRKVWGNLNKFMVNGNIDEQKIRICIMRLIFIVSFELENILKTFFCKLYICVGTCVCNKFTCTESKTK